MIYNIISVCMCISMYSVIKQNKPNISPSLAPHPPLSFHAMSQGAVTYQLSASAVSGASVFRQLEANKERLGIVDYSVSQTTLDQVEYVHVCMCIRMYRISSNSVLL